MNLLVVRVGALGDVLHALPAVHALRLAHPAWTISWAIDPRWSPLLESCPDSTPPGSTAPGQTPPEETSPARPVVSALHPVPTRLWKQHPVSLGTARSVVSLTRSLRSRHFRLAVDLQGSLRSALIGRLAGAALFAGPARPREAPARLLYGRRLPISAAHVVDQAAQLLSAAVGEPLSPTLPPLPHDPAAEHWCNNLLRTLDPRRGLVLLVPQAGWGAKQWPAPHFAELALALAAEGFRPLVNQAHPADPLAAEVAALSAGAALPVLCSLPELIALIRRTALVVAGDTGPLHLASTLARPLVALFGPTDPARTGPWAPPSFAARSTVLRHPESTTDHRRQPATEAGLAEIPVAAVAQAALDLLETTPVAQ